MAGWWHQIINQSVQAPLAPAIASLVDWATGGRVLNVFAVSLLGYAVLLLATLGLTKAWPRLGRWTALFFVGAAPVLLDYSRSHFAELVAGCLAASLYFAHRSSALSRVAPSLAWGACLGFMVLSRTMTFAFVPGPLIAAALPVAARRSATGLLRLCAGMVVGAGLSATWYVHNLASVATYLTSFGYGARAAAFGAPRSLWSPHDWYSFFLQLPPVDSS